MHLPISYDILFIVVLVMIGIVAGYTAGLFGFGGGIVLVPTLLTLFPFFGASHANVMHCAIGTALALIVPTGLMSAYKHYKLEHIDLKFAKRYLPWTVLGAIAGSLSMHAVPTLALKITFTCYLYFAALYTGFKTSAAKAGTSVRGYPHNPIVYAGSLLIGGVSVWLGMGGGTFSVPFLRAFGYPYRRCIGLSAAIGILIGAVGAIGAVAHGWGEPGRAHYSIGFVNLLAFIIIAPITMYLAPRGAMRAAKLSDRTLKWLYVSLLSVIAVYMTAMILFYHH